jgi:hypothetical protein
LWENHTGADEPRLITEKQGLAPRGGIRTYGFAVNGRNEQNLSSLAGVAHMKLEARVAHNLLKNPSFGFLIVEGGGTLSSRSDQEVSFTAPSSPVLVRLSVAVSQRDMRCSAEALITVADSLDVAIGPAVVNARGLPGYTFERAAGELWRSRFDAVRNLIVVNSGHRDFVFATRSRALQLRYLVRLYVKELVLKNFPGLAAEQVAERMIELSLYVEEKLKST